MRALDRAREVAGDAFPQLANCCQTLREQLVHENSGRTQSDSVVAQVIRSRANLHKDLEAHRRGRAGESLRAFDAKERALALAVAKLDEQARAIAGRERALGNAERTREEATRQRARREAIENASRGFTSGDLGNGHDNGGGDLHLRARIELINSVFRLGEERPPLCWRVRCNCGIID